MGLIHLQIPRGSSGLPQGPRRFKFWSGFIYISICLSGERIHGRYGRLRRARAAFRGGVSTREQHEYVQPHAAHAPRRAPGRTRPEVPARASVAGQCFIICHTLLLMYCA